MDSRQAVILWALISAVLMVVGGFAPWAKVLGVLTINGTEGDGWFHILGGILGGGLLIVRQVTASPKRWFAIVALVLAAICVLVAIVDLADIEGMAGDDILAGAVSASWGLYLALIASLSLLAASIASLVVGAPAPAPAAVAQPAFAGGPAAADWYPDPQGQKRLRYWDGSAWTDHTAD